MSSSKTKILKQFFLSYLLSWVILISIFSGIIWNRGFRQGEFMEVWVITMKYLIFNSWTWIILTIPFLLIRLVYYLKNAYSERGVYYFFKQLFYVLGIPAIVLFISAFTLHNVKYSEKFDYKWDHAIENATGKVNHKFDDKQRGVHYFGRRDAETDYDQLIKCLSLIHI